MEILNRKARYDYVIEDTYEAGIVLTGTEIKSVRQGKVNIKDSYAIIRNDEIYLLNTHISIYEEGNRFNHEEDRTRKLLLHKREILKLKNKLEIEGYTLIPLRFYFVKGRRIIKNDKNLFFFFTLILLFTLLTFCSLTLLFASIVAS